MIGSHGIYALMFHGLANTVPPYFVFRDTRTCLILVEEFERLIRWCLKRYQFIKVSELDSFVKTNHMDCGKIILTFDDTLSHTVELIVPLLKKYQIPGLFFVTTDWATSEETPLVFTFEKWLWHSAPIEITVTINGHKRGLSVPSRAYVAEAVSELWRFMFELEFPPSQLNKSHIQSDHEDLHHLFADYESLAWKPASWDMINWALSSGLVEIGSHMVTHRPLTWLSKEDREQEMRESKTEIESKTGEKLLACSYPHGAIDEATINIAKAYYRWGFSSKGGSITADVDPLDVPRIHVPGERPDRVKLEVKYPHIMRAARFMNGL